ncbi:MAG: class I SAM-dependent DNA methyltransferase [Actinomycetales bacterium]|nr:class I SAM-dependent DNA methyltransferase [Actinomycetales bacterium]
MFQSVRDAETRRALGEHYTSEENILKTLDPLFLDELRDELAAALARDTTQKKVNSLNKLWDRLGAIRFMDPACGCGNFIIVAYRELREIELEVMTALADLRVAPGSSTLDADWTRLLKVSLDHFYGIEIDEWPARIAETAMFMMDRQCDLKLRERFGQAPERLPIQREAKIVVGNALRLEWSDILAASEHVVVAGNPPFLGHNSRTAEQSSELRDLWRRDDIGRLDYVTGWYAKSLDYFNGDKGRWAFVSTSSVVQGEPVPALFGPVFRGGWRIRFAHQVFPWESEATGAAAVHCVIVGFDREQAPALLVRYSANGVEISRDRIPGINAYLHAAPNVLVEQRRRPLSPELAPFGFGSRPNDGGSLVVEAADAPEVRQDVVAARYLRKYVGARELLHGQDRWCLWLADVDKADIERSPVLRDRLARCRQHRLNSKRPATREWADRPHLFDFDSQPKAAYVCAPGLVSEKRPYFLATRFAPDVIASNLAYTAIDPDGVLFGLISSSMFIAWQRAVGGRLESRLRFSNTVVWNNFPVPKLTRSQREVIAAAGQSLARARVSDTTSTLAEQYAIEPLPKALRDAHARLDEVVDEALGFAGQTADERVEHLFALFQLLLDSEGKFQ